MLNEYSAAMEARTPSVSAPFYADAITSRFANAPVVPAATARSLRWLTCCLESGRWARAVNVWEEDGGVVDSEVDRIWNLLDG